MVPTVVITGCNAGLGHSLAQIALSKGYKTFATSRTDGPGLKKLQQAGAHTSTLDVGSLEAIDAFKKSFGDGPLDLLIHNAAVYAGFFDKLGDLKAEHFEEQFRVNATGPLFLTQALLPNLEASALASSSTAADQRPTQVAHIATRGASIDDNTSGGAYAYRASKTAMNMIGKNLAVDLRSKKIVVSMVHPGMVQTSMFPGAQSPLMVTADFAAEKCWDVIMKTTLETTGRFWHRDGFELPW